jgi:hypothetical protein
MGIDGYDGDGGDARDTRLMMQLGVVIGLVYAAFLTFWVWATRIRNPRTEQRW